ncbi:hypothetical protein NC651_004682 [Populus alba x Populus x berolinensis]|nr:hypothetical protein NC651_004682 [Populus alba x Populus x berolinensis]
MPVQREIIQGVAKFLFILRDWSFALTFYVVGGGLDPGGGRWQKFNAHEPYSSGNGVVNHTLTTSLLDGFHQRLNYQIIEGVPNPGSESPSGLLNGGELECGTNCFFAQLKDILGSPALSIITGAGPTVRNGSNGMQHRLILLTKPLENFCVKEGTIIYKPNALKKRLNDILGATLFLPDQAGLLLQMNSWSLMQEGAMSIVIRGMMFYLRRWHQFSSHIIPCFCLFVTKAMWIDIFYSSYAVHFTVDVLKGVGPLLSIFKSMEIAIMALPITRFGPRESCHEGRWRKSFFELSFMGTQHSRKSSDPVKILELLGIKSCKDRELDNVYSPRRMWRGSPSYRGLPVIEISLFFQGKCHLILPGFQISGGITHNLLELLFFLILLDPHNFHGQYKRMPQQYRLKQLSNNIQEIIDCRPTWTQK